MMSGATLFYTGRDELEGTPHEQRRERDRARQDRSQPPLSACVVHFVRKA